MDAPGISYVYETAVLAAGEAGTLTLGKTLLYIAGIILFLLMNAFFVASEFAIVKVRRSQIDAGAEKRPRRSKVALQVVKNLDSYLSANQLGITIASLALGFLVRKVAAGDLIEFIAILFRC